MRILKNRSNEEGFKPVTVDVKLTTHPITNPSEYVDIPVNPKTGKVSDAVKKAYRPEDKSPQYRIIIEPGESMRFGEADTFNEEHAEFIYSTCGDREVPPEEKITVRNWLIEVDEEGNERKDITSFWEKYRKPRYRPGSY